MDKAGDRLGGRVGSQTILCPQRFDQDDTILKHLADIVGFNESESFIAHEVPFMRSPTTNKAAGLIDVVLINGKDVHEWYGLEIQAVYFSGPSMSTEFEILEHDNQSRPPYPRQLRRPDWRSSGAKRLMPQLQIKVPTLRQWGTKMAVAVDVNFFNAIGGVSGNSTHDINEGDIIWLVIGVSNEHALEVRHWAVLSLEDSAAKLLAAKRIKRSEFETILHTKLQHLDRTKRTW